MTKILFKSLNDAGSELSGADSEGFGGLVHADSLSPFAGSRGS